jgi:hypothetical protein
MLYTSQNNRSLYNGLIFLTPKSSDEIFRSRLVSFYFRPKETSAASGGCPLISDL